MKLILIAEIYWKLLLSLDAIGVSIGGYVGYEVSTQAIWPFEDKLVSFYSTITAIIDYINIREPE
jgi:hypothetical protein